MKKIVSLVLAISMVMSMFVSAFAASATFEDVTDPNCAGAIEALVELGVVNGLPDGTFAPENKVTRAQLAKMLVLCTGIVEGMSEAEAEEYFADYADNKVFNDVEGHWGAGYVNAAAQLKLISGYPDGSFKPNKDVSYAEAITMMIRALGYGNVVDAEGTWPVAYTAKARELGLYDNVKGAVAGDAAIRGNVAILLWNMLTTPMWKIQEESEGNGMTSYAKDELMLNVKFPDYKYVEEATIYSITVVDQDVDIALQTSVDEDQKPVLVTAKADGQYLPNLLIGMKVSALIKDWKDVEDATYLTLTPANTVVEGVVTKVTDTRVTIEETAYRPNEKELFVDDYVVAEVEGSKILHVETLPQEAVEVEKIKTMESQIKNEDALVIIDGEWATRDDIEVGDVYTVFADENGVNGTYYVVARERLEGTFESFTVENDDDEYAYVEVDGEEYRAFRDLLEVYEGEDNDELVDEEDLREKEKDNKYLDNDVELVLNYLGQVVTIYFGEVSDLDADGNFYVVVSDGAWRESTSKGEVKHILLVGVDGEEEAYTFAKGATLPAELETDAVYKRAEEEEVATFVYVKFNDDGEIKEIEMLTEDVYDDYKVEEFAAEMTDDNYLANVTGSKVTASTVVFRATPVLDDDDNVTGFEIEVSEGAEALNRVDEGMVAYDDTTATKRAKYVFVSDDAKSDYEFGLVESTRERKGTFYATISGTEYRVADPDENLVYEEDIVPLVGKLVAFTEENGKITVEVELAAADVDNVDDEGKGAAIVTELDDEFVTFDQAVPVAGTWETPETATTIDVLSEDAMKLYEKFTFLKVSAYLDDENNVKFEDDIEELGTGVENMSAKKGDRVVMDAEEELVVIVTGFAADDVIEDGKLVVE